MSVDKPISLGWSHSFSCSLYTWGCSESWGPK